VRLGDRRINDPVELFDDLVRLIPPLFPTLERGEPSLTYVSGTTCRWGTRTAAGDQQREASRCRDHWWTKSMSSPSISVTN
jgi:hypothetical protein